MCRSLLFSVCVLAAALSPASAKLDPALTPPMGWRSWNSFLLNVNEDNMMAVAAALAKKPTSGGPSLAEAGYGRVGIDDGWQACGSGVDGSFHDSQGNPLVNTDRFPDLKAMVAKVKSMYGLEMGFYMNNCFCSGQERKAWKGTPPNGGHPAQDTALVADAGFTGMKVDGCGPAHNITAWYLEVQKAEQNIVVENCGDNHLSWTPPDPSVVAQACPFNLYRVSTDIAPQFESTMYNLQKRALYPMSRPGCWGYPDMMQVGNEFCGLFGCKSLTPTESKTHFAAWTVSSSPLTLGANVTNATVYDVVYPIVTNKLALSVSHAWDNDPGRIVANSSETFTTKVYHGATATGSEMYTFPTWQAWAKSMGDGNVAALLINISDKPLSADVALSKFGVSSAMAEATDVWTGKSVTVKSMTATNLAAHDSLYWILKPTN